MGKHVIVGGGNSASNYINTGAGMMGVGDLRFNTSTQQIEFYNGQNWQTFIMAQATVGLAGPAETAIDWALDKIQQEKKPDAWLNSILLWLMPWVLFVRLNSN